MCVKMYATLVLHSLVLDLIVMVVKCFPVNCGMVDINFPPYSLGLAPANFLSFVVGTAPRGQRKVSGQ